MALPPQTLGSFAVAADVFTMLVLLAPWLTAVPAIYKSREVGRRSPLPNIAAVLSCCVALLYGCSRRDGLVIGVNVAGAVMQAGYVGVFVYFSPAWRLVPLQHCAVATVTYAALICFHLFGLIDAGGLAYAAGACAWLVPTMIFYNVSKVWKDMSMECMPHVIVLVLSLVSTPLWIVYAYGGKELNNYVRLPNCLGLAYALLQVGLHGYFWKRGREQTNIDERAPLLEGRSVDPAATDC
ncbi:hypothetical protein ZWY2020_057989 [Hordeum vulgare]|nr:hypothetical protein ZWY2020_057989 [Hordeum vulgare]